MASLPHALILGLEAESRRYPNSSDRSCMFCKLLSRKEVLCKFRWHEDHRTPRDRESLPYNLLRRRGRKCCSSLGSYLQGQLAESLQEQKGQKGIEIAVYP